MKLRQRILRAREELVRCSVELRRLQTAIRDEKILFAETLRTMDNTDPSYGAVRDFVIRRVRVNERIMIRIHEAHSLEYFPCEKEPGIRLGSQVPITDLALGEVDSLVGLSDNKSRSGEGHDGDMSDSDEEDDDEIQGEVGNLVDYIAE